MLFGLLSFERRDPRSDVLVVTNGWPTLKDPAYCVFIERQVDSLCAAGVRSDVLFIRGYRSALAYPAAAIAFLLWSARRRSQYAVVHSHGGEAALAASFYLRAPIVASYLGDDLLGRPRADGSVSYAGRLKRGLIRQHARCLSRTITKTREMQMCLPVSARARNRVIPNGVDRQVFTPGRADDARRRLGWATDTRVALVVAKLHSGAQVARKRVWLAEQAIEIVRRRVPEARLEVASDVVPSEIPTYMNAADCLILTSSSEGSPNAVKEALMCNLPVVATAVGDVEELLDGVEPSYLVSESPAAIAEAVSDCFARGERSNGRDRSAHLGSDVVAQRVIDVYAAAGASRERTWGTRRLVGRDGPRGGGGPDREIVPQDVSR